MGLLDDAIREHLDLKRRRGADPTEIERAEREALGPVRRGPDISGDDAPHAEAAEPTLESEADVASAPAEDFDPFHEDVEVHDDEFHDHEAVELHEAVEFHEPAAATEEHEELPPHDRGEPVEGESIPDASPFDAESESSPPHPADVAPEPEPNLAPEPKLAPHPAEPPPSAVPPHEDQETEEYELEPEEQEGGDVLESTPEFLQDAPDHDRLWFEQRPPRDFDFDG